MSVKKLNSSGTECFIVSIGLRSFIVENTERNQVQPFHSVDDKSIRIWVKMRRFTLIPWKVLSAFFDFYFVLWEESISYFSLQY